jgi:CheY-like chemotaxis protein
MERPSQQRRQYERRRMFDRRSPHPQRHGTDRRRGQRRVGTAGPPGRERRQGIERRAAVRRRVADRRLGAPRRRGARRRDTPTPFSLEHLQTLRESFAHRGPVTCPACGGQLTLGMARSRGSDTIRRVNCLGCGRAAILTNTRAVRILVIAAKEAVREALRTVLAGAGHEVVEAGDAGVGLVAYETLPTDVVFIDVRASGRMDAGEFVRRLRRSFPDARVVGIAGRPSYGTLDPLAVTHGLGAVGTVRLPFSPADVLRAVDEARG